MIDDLDKLTMLVGALTGDPDGAADTVNKRHQAKAANSTTLPKPGDVEAAWVKLGVEFGDSVDDLFVSATLPDGWTKQPTDHPMHTAIIDADGNRRGSYFYKGAFWDRDAFLSAPVCRFSLERGWGADERNDGLGKPTFTLNAVDARTNEILMVFTADKPADLEVQARAAAWLDETRPEWRDPGAYWDLQ